MNKIYLIFIFLSLLFIPVHPQKFVLQLSIDGPDLNNEYGTEELIRLGEFDHIGSLSYGGDIIGIRGKMLGNPEFFSKRFKGVLYELSPISGGNNEFIHPNAVLAIKVVSPHSWELIVSAMVRGDSSVTVDQLKFKQDDQSEYIPFTPSPHMVSRGGEGTYNLFYDLALMIERNDKPGTYVWQINYVLVTY